MPVLFVLCDTDVRQSGVNCFASALKECGDALPVSEYSYILKTAHSAEDVYARLKTRVGNRSLWVFTMPEPYTGQAPASVKQWLEEVGNRYIADRRAVPRN
jgi:hypothetical protein